MNWYKNIKVSASDRRAFPVRHYVDKYRDGTVDITFDMTRPGGTFRLMTREPVSNSYLNLGSSGSIFIKLKDEGKLTTPLARRRKESQERINSQTNQPQETVEEEPQPQRKPPEQLQFNFSSKRSKLLHRKARINSIKGGMGDDVEVKDVDKEELIMGIKVELEHIGKGVSIPSNIIREFVENQIDENNKTFKNQKILETSQDIAIDHLCEIDDYYTRLAKMEKEAKENKNEKEINSDVKDNTK